MSLQSEILDGLRTPGWDASIAAVKTVVRNSLQRLDRTAEIHDTAYFNHSFVPDFIVTWPREADRQRDVFLRLDASASFLHGDLHFLGDTKPILLGLSAVEDAQSNEDAPQLVEAVGTSPAMITEPAAVEALGEPPSAAQFTHVLPAAMLKAGHGLVQEETAVSLSDASEAFFSGARSHERDQLAQSVEVITKFLDVRQTERLLNLGRVLWEATGGDPVAFPVTSDLGHVDDSGLRYLLEELPIGDIAFWRSVGRLVSLERLLGLGVRESPNLTSLIRANADRLNGRVLLVKPAQQRLDDEEPSWSVAAGALALHGSDFVAYIAPKRDDITVNAEPATGLGLDDFRRRTNSEQVETVTVTASDGKTVNIRSENIFDPTTDDVVASVAALPGARVDRVGLIVSGKHLECDFTDRSASGYTNAIFDVLSLLERGLPLLWPLHHRADVDEIRTIRRLVNEVSLPLTLFDDDGG